VLKVCKQADLHPFGLARLATIEDTEAILFRADVRLKIFVARQVLAIELVGLPL
jgi:hypothetical protein